MTSTKHENAESGKLTLILWAATAFLSLGLLFARAVYPELLWLTILAAVALLGALIGLVQQNAQALRGRTAAYGLNSAVTVALVLGIVGVVNFLGHEHPFKKDFTKNKIHTLSDQTDKLIKGLQKPLKAVLFAKAQQRETYRPLLESYRQLNPGKFEIEYVDPDREITRAKEAGLKKYGTLVITLGARENKIEEPTEEKLTNGIIKISKDKMPQLCAVTGHGEKSFSAGDQDGFDAAKRALAAESYEVKDLNLVQEGKIPASCDALAILGPTKSFFEPELKLIRSYLDNGGRAIVGVDLNIKGDEYSPELLAVLDNWGVKAERALIVDPLSKMMGADASMPIVATYAKDQPITRDFQANSMMPFLRPLGIEKGVDSGLKVQWLGQTTPRSWAVSDMKELASGQVKVTEGKDRMGPLNAIVVVSGRKKGSKAARDTRLVAFGTSLFANNNFSRYGGNMDLFLNSVSWIMDDESLISIHTKDEGPGRVELSQKEGTVVFLLTVIVIPFLIAVSGIVFWVIRKRL